MYQQVSLCPFQAARLFRHDGVARKTALNLPQQVLFRAMIHVGDEIDAPFVLNGKIPFVSFAQNLPGAAGKFL